MEASQYHEVDEVTLRTHCQGGETQKLCQLGVLGKSWEPAAVTSTTTSAQAEADALLSSEVK